MLYDTINNILLTEVGLEYSSLGFIFADLISIFLSVVFSLAPIIVSFVILFACIKGVKR